MGATDASESFDDKDPHRSGWYFMFNTKQGHYHDGIPFLDGGTVIPLLPSGPTGGSGNPIIDEDTDWEIENDPCHLLLGGDWRIPTFAEWEAAAIADADLHIHAAGYLPINLPRALFDRGSIAEYWTSSQESSIWGQSVIFEDGEYNPDRIIGPEKSVGKTLRFIKD